MLVSLEERAKQYVNEEDGQIRVDWKALAIAERDSRIMSNRSFNSLMDNILKYLHEKKVLVYDNTPKSYFATGANVPLHPRLSESITRFSFVNEQDARDYYTNFFKHPVYGIILHQTISPV
ncbi:hypothetical protein J4429_01600 [Candidatus Pacearchaeota archaeon]|nr:hypothetical protein [Candidatus Pacearchaeota archaeon]